MLNVELKIAVSMLSIDVFNFSLDVSNIPQCQAMSSDINEKEEENISAGIGWFHWVILNKYSIPSLYPQNKANFEYC